MSAVIIAIAAALIALLAKKKTDDLADDVAEESPLAALAFTKPVETQNAPAGRLTAVGTPKVTITIDGKVQTGKTVVLPSNADHIKISTAWMISNSRPTAHLAGMKLRWIHERGGRPDDDWAEWLPYFDASTGLRGLVEDDLLKDTGVPLMVRHGVFQGTKPSKMQMAPKMAQIPPASTRTFVVDIVIPGPRRSGKLAKFWKDHNGANFKLEPEMVADYQPDQGPSGIEKFLAGGLLLGDVMGPAVFGGATRVAGSAQSTEVYSLKKATLPSFMTIAFQTVAKGTSQVTIKQPAAKAYTVGDPVPYSAEVKIVSPETFPKTAPPIRWQYRVTRASEKPSGWAALSGSNGKVRFQEAGEYTFQATVDDSEQHGYAGSFNTITFESRKAQAAVHISRPQGNGPWRVGETVRYEALVTIPGQASATGPVEWSWERDGSGFTPLGSGGPGKVVPLFEGRYTFRAVVPATSSYEGAEDRVFIDIGAKAATPPPTPKFKIGDRVTNGFATGIVDGVDWDSAEGMWFYGFVDRFGFVHHLRENALWKPDAQPELFNFFVPELDAVQEFVWVPELDFAYIPVESDPDPEPEPVAPVQEFVWVPELDFAIPIEPEPDPVLPAPMIFIPELDFAVPMEPEPAPTVAAPILDPILGF